MVSSILENIEILWDGDSTIAVAKPAGLATQAPLGIPSVESELVKQLAGRCSRIWFPHRLDRPVGGVMLVALTKKAARLLSAQFAARRVRKEYHATVQGTVDGPTIWSDYLIKIPDQAMAAVVPAEHDGAQAAETAVEVIEVDAANDRTRLRLCPRTGRMHQLRVQSAHRGHPIVGDVLYGAKAQSSEQIVLASVQTTLASERIMLTAHSVVFHDPRNGKQVTVTTSDSLGDRV